MVKGFRQIAVLTVISRVLGFVRDMAFAYFLGAGRLFGAWAIAFKIPNLARRLFGEGAAAASFIPVYSEELHHRPDTAKKLACTVVTVVTVILACIVLAGEAIIWLYYSFVSKDPDTNLMLNLAGIMLPYMILICVVAILAGILQTHRHFATPAAAPSVLNIFIIGSLCFSGWIIAIEPDKQVFVVAIAVIIAGVFQLAMQFIPLRKIGIGIRPAWQVRSEAFKKILILMGPMILGLTATQLNTLADDIIAWLFSVSDAKGETFSFFDRVIQYPLPAGAVSHLYYSQRLYQFPLGVLGISLATAIFPVMSSDAAKGDTTALSKTISKGLRGAIFIALPATAGLILIRTILVQWAFQRGQFQPSDTPLTATVLLFYSLGLCGYFLQQIVTRAFYSLQDSKAPAKTAALAVGINVILNLTLIWVLGTGGLALSTAICSYLQVGLLLFALRKRFDGTILNGFGKTFIKTIIATVIMYAVGLLILKVLPDGEINLLSGAIKLTLIVISCSAAYIITAKMIKTQMLSLLFSKKHS
ncbi:MAG: murein biosynthesis integral membrane protein MurJ [Sedimentisphaerales bacterium]|nr:murein biosynthesis integral membrane protein MurJ [Sedimentisphaerales bacterium]